MKYRLLISVEVLQFLERLPSRLRRSLRNLIAEIGDDPMRCSDATEYDRDGRLMHLAIRNEYALVYWIDDADRHVKVMEIHAADL